MSNSKSKNLFLALLLIASANLVSLPVAAEQSAIVNLKQTGRAFASIAKDVSPAVVNIQSDQSLNAADVDSTDDVGPSDDELPQQYLDLFRGLDPRMQPQLRRQPVSRQGSGFIISKEGYIVTNNHLVQNAGKITVKLYDDREFVAKLIGSDPQSDIAVIKIEAPNLPVVVLGDSDDAEVGEWVVAIGNPFGLSHSISAGILSAKGRNIGIADYENFLQTDAAINPGNSGGCLVDLEGKVIGINTAIYSRSGGSMGIGFAIPINMAKTIIDQLTTKGIVVRGYLGVMIQQLTKDLAENFGLKDTKGILVARVEKDTPADKSGLKQGDIIVSLDGKPVDNLGVFRNTIAASKPKSVHPVGILRDKKPMQIQITVGALENETAAKTPKAQDQQAVNKFGINVQNIPKDLAAKLGIKPDTGVMVSRIKPGSLAEMASLSKGTVILEVNRVKVDSVKQFTDEITKAEKSKSVLFLIQDQYGSRYVVINAG